MSVSSGNFFEGHEERKKDGDVVSILPVTIFVVGRLTQKEVGTLSSFVLTEKALYEFKGTVLSAKETRRIPFDELRGAVLNSENADRFSLLQAQIKNTKVYECLQKSTREDFVAKVKSAFDAWSPNPLKVLSLPNAKFARMQMMTSTSTAALTWESVFAAPELLEEENGESKQPQRKPSLKKKKSIGGVLLTAEDSAALDAEEECLPSVILQRIEDVLKANPSQAASAYQDKLKQTWTQLESTVVVAKKDELQHALALCGVLMDSVSCVHLFQALMHKGPFNLLEDLETNLGNKDVIVRRWLAMAFASSLDALDQMGFLPTTPTWQAVSKLYADQIKTRENAATKLLFPPSVPVEMNAAFALGDGDSDDEAPAAAKHKSLKQEKRSGLGILSFSQVAKPAAAPAANNRRSSLLSKGLASAQKRGSTLFGSVLAIAGGASINEEEVGGRRLRSVVGLLWMSKLLDLEAKDASYNVGIRKLDVQTMFQLLLGKAVEPTSVDARVGDFEVETFGATVQYPEYFLPIVGCLAAMKSDDVRSGGLKQMNVLLMRNTSAMKAFLSVPDWQSLIFSNLFSVPFSPTLRSPAQDEIYNYSLHLTTTLILSVLGSKSPWDPLESTCRHASLSIL